MGFRPGPWIESAVANGLIALSTSPIVRVEPPDLGCSEKEFQAAVVKLAVGNGWLVYHPFDSRRSEPGYPDLTMVRRRVLVFAELKTLKGRLRPEQREWLECLASVPGIIVKRWRPSDWSDCVEILTEPIS